MEFFERDIFSYTFFPEAIYFWSRHYTFATDIKHWWSEALRDTSNIKRKILIGSTLVNTKLYLDILNELIKSFLKIFSNLAIAL